eukprot:scaffold34304_cov64-Phaeocystis_antarctica.AAC.4
MQLEKGLLSMWCGGIACRKVAAVQRFCQRLKRSLQPRAEPGRAGAASPFSIYLCSRFSKLERTEVRVTVRLQTRRSPGSRLARGLRGCGHLGSGTRGRTAHDAHAHAWPH